MQHPFLMPYLLTHPNPFTYLRSPPTAAAAADAVVVSMYFQQKKNTLSNLYGGSTMTNYRRRSGSARRGMGDRRTVPYLYHFSRWSWPHSIVIFQGIQMSTELVLSL